MKRKLMSLAAAAAWTALLAVPSYALDLGGLVDTVKDNVPQKAAKATDKDTEGKAESALKLPPYKGPKKRLAVMDMEVKVVTTHGVEPTATGGTMATTSVYIPPPADFGTGLTEMLTTALVDSGRFIMLERKALMDIQQEQALGAGGSVDQTSTVPMGKLLGAQTLIRGAVTEYSYKKSSTGGNAKFLEGVSIAASKAEASVTLDIRIYSVATGQIIDSVKAEGRAKASATAVDIDKEDYKVSGSGFKQTPLGHATRQAIDKAVAFVCQRMEAVPWEGRIAELDAEDTGEVNTIYINAGSETGLKEGMVFDILRPGRDIVDPETKVAIGRTKDKRLGRCKIETLSKNLSTAEPLEGQGFQVNDIVCLPVSEKQLVKEKLKPENTEQPETPSDQQPTQDQSTTTESAPTDANATQGTQEQPASGDTSENQPSGNSSGNAVVE